VTRISWERLAALAGLSFVVLYVVAFSLGIEVGDSDREILAYYANSGHRAKEIVAFFLIAGAALGTRSAVRVDGSGEVSALLQFGAAAADQQVGAVHGLAAARAGDKVLPGPLGERSVGVGGELLPLAHGLAARARRR
jgi:hypothetical protein